MTATYKLITDALTGTDSTKAVQRTADSAFIPTDSRNADYFIYTAWLAAPNTPDAA